VGTPPNSWVAWYEELKWVQWTPNLTISPQGVIRGEGNDLGDFVLQPFSIEGNLQTITENVHFTFVKQYYRDDNRLRKTHHINYNGHIVHHKGHWLWIGKWGNSCSSGRFVCYAPTLTSPTSPYTNTDLDLELGEVHADSSVTLSTLAEV
jgi:hypothetical protein